MKVNKQGCWDKSVPAGPECEPTPAEAEAEKARQDLLRRTGEAVNTVYLRPSCDKATSDLLRELYTYVWSHP